MRNLWRILKWILIALLVVVIGLAIWIGPKAYSALHPSHEHDRWLRLFRQHSRTRQSWSSPKPTASAMTKPSLLAI